MVMETKIHIYDINNMKILHTIDTVPNPKGTSLVLRFDLSRACDGSCVSPNGILRLMLYIVGICAFSPDDNSFIAYPGPTTGEVYIFDALALRNVSIVPAHKG